MKKSFSFRGSTSTTNWRWQFLFLLPMLFIGLVSQAQEMKELMGPTVICPASFEGMHGKNDIYHLYTENISFKTKCHQIN